MASLKEFETFTKVCEAGHLISFAGMAAALGVFLESKSMSGVLFAAGLNMLINVYPILLQRYNRIRLYRIIHKLRTKL